MAITLYEATVERFLQTLGAVAGVLDKGLAHCAEVGIDPQAMTDTRLWPDMQTLGFQAGAIALYSLGAIESVQRGLYTVPDHQKPYSYPEMQALVAGAREGLERLSPAEVDALAGREVLIDYGEVKMAFEAAGFLLSFSLPSFYFHATTAYDILRSKGVPIGKMDFLGQMRLMG